ncbi:hypothetical protein [Oceanivirga salmonicida]|uniref:hypothetical protein n=1 Tax=Oceanivirga salmonicida TaxID=1769291 RepID=UPI0012E14BC7|nr:hypothetical protein [Oceanivirga salmonicida]
MRRIVIFNYIEEFGYLNIIGLIVLGLFVAFVVSYFKKRKAEKNKVEGASILVLKKQNIYNENFADQIKVKEVNGEKVTEFIYSGRPAIYIGPGSNEIVVYAKLGNRKTVVKKLNLKIDYDKVYTLYYILQTNQYLLCEGYEFEKEVNDIIAKGQIL